EGATLGGKLIARRLRRQLGVTPDAGAAFYFSYGEDLGAMWKAFKAALNAHAARSEAPEDTYVTAARSTFLAMERWVSEPASHEHTRPAAG
ncbi:MAG: biliverdin-producing heme oxygenase, partial [Bacteroidota bacterium]